MMSGPARAGALIYAKDVERLAGFYEALLPMTRVRTTEDLIVLGSPDFQLLIQAMPSQISAIAQTESSLIIRDQAAIKLFFTVASIAEARAKAHAIDGAVFTEQWSGPGFRVCNAFDPEGNIFQLRESAP